MVEKTFIGVPSTQAYSISNIDNSGADSMSSPKLIAVGTPLAVYGTEIGPGERVIISCDATFTTKPFTVITDHETITYSPPGLGLPPTVAHEVTVSGPNGTLSRYAATSTSIDSRKMYGVPNAQGQPVGLDPNSPSRPINFSTSDYEGGLFSGYVAPLTMDQSGKSRVQVYGTSVPTVSRGVGVTIVCTVLGNSRYGGVSDLSAWAVAASDPYYGQTRSTVTWDTRWTTRDGTIGSLGGAPGTGLQSFQCSTSTSLPKRFVIESANETSLVSGWTYFASDLYLASHPGLVDPQIHIFVLDGGPPSLTYPYTYTDNNP